MKLWLMQETLFAFYLFKRRYFFLGTKMLIAFFNINFLFNLLLLKYLLMLLDLATIIWYNIL